MILLDHLCHALTVIKYVFTNLISEPNQMHFFNFLYMLLAFLCTTKNILSWTLHREIEKINKSLACISMLHFVNITI